MDENLIGYLLDALDERERQQVEIDLQRCPETRARLFSLKRALMPLAADRDAPLPPTDLLVRTLARIAQHECGGATAPQTAEHLPRAPAISPSTWSHARSWWRRADVLAAACMLIMATGIGLTVLGRARSAAMIADCQNNLQQLFVALEQYRDVRGQFPDVPQGSQRSMVPVLADAGNLAESEFAPGSACVPACYTYPLGYRDATGNYHPPGADARVLLSQLPIMADQASGDVLSFCSNHGTIGQNVLYSDGHVSLCPALFGE
jgi:hypothetical protein